MGRLIHPRCLDPRPPRRQGAGALLFIVMIAVLVLASMGLFQYFAEQVTRGQRSIREANYMRYLGEAALTEATINLLQAVNAKGGEGEGGDTGTNPADVLRQLIQEPIDVSTTQGLAKTVLGRGTVDIKVEALLDKDGPPDPEHGAWGDTDAEKKVSKVAFEGEDQGLLTLVATVRVEDPLGGDMTGSMSRAFAYRVVSPLPPTGLDKVTFLAHNWKYFRARQEEASRELFRMVRGRAGLVHEGSQHVIQRSAGLNATANYTRTIGKLTLSLIKVFKENPTTGQAMYDTLRGAIGDACQPECRVQMPRADGLPGTEEVAWPAEKFAGCMLVSDTLNDTWRGSIAGILRDRKVCSPDYIDWMNNPANQPSSPNDPPPPIPWESFRPATDPSDLAQCVAQANIMLQGGNAKPLSEDFDTAIQEFNDRAGKYAERYAEQDMEGLRLPSCHHPGFEGDKIKLFDLMLERARTVNPGRDPWKVLIGTTIRTNLKNQLKNMRQEPGAAGKQMSIENFMLWSSLPYGTFLEDKTKSLEALGELRPSDADLGDTALTYPGMDEVGLALKALNDRIVDEGRIDSEAEPEPPADAGEAARRLSDEVAKIVNPSNDQYHAAYMGAPKTWAYRMGPLYTTEAVNQDKLQYTFAPAPLRTDLLKHFPLPPGPPERAAGAGSYVGGNFLGFVTLHANWSRKLAEESSGSEPPEDPSDDTAPSCPTDTGFEPDYSADSDSGDPLAKTINTDCVAWQMATAYGAPGHFEAATGDLDESVKKVLEGKADDPELRGDGKPVLREAYMKDPGLTRYSTPVHEGISPSSIDKISGDTVKVKDHEAVQQYTAGWNKLVEGFLKTYSDANRNHQDLFKAWPLDVPDPKLEPWRGPAEGNTAGLAAGQPPGWTAAYDDSTLKQLSEYGSVPSGGQVYVQTVLDPDINRQRSAFRFPSAAKFLEFLASGCGRVEGTYFVDGGDATTLDIPAVLELMKKFGCDELPSDPVLPLRGFAYISFPGSLELKGGTIVAIGPNDKPGDYANADALGRGRLVLLAKGVKLTGPKTEITGMILSNGGFMVEGGTAKVTGTLVTTGTKFDETKTADALVETLADPDTKLVPLDKAPDLLGETVGQLDPIQIDPLPAIAGGRTSQLKLIFSPFRVSQDFEMRRQ